METSMGVEMKSVLRVLTRSLRTLNKPWKDMLMRWRREDDAKMSYAWIVIGTSHVQMLCV
jgi:hypothetical protein